MRTRRLTTTTSGLKVRFEYEIDYGHGAHGVGSSDMQHVMVRPERTPTIAEYNEANTKIDMWFRSMGWQAAKEWRYKSLRIHMGFRRCGRSRLVPLTIPTQTAYDP